MCCSVTVRQHNLLMALLLDRLSLLQSHLRPDFTHRCSGLARYGESSRGFEKSWAGQLLPNRHPLMLQSIPLNMVRPYMAALLRTSSTPCTTTLDSVP